MSYSRIRTCIFILSLGVFALGGCNSQKKNAVLYNLHMDLYKKNIQLYKELDALGPSEGISVLVTAFKEFNDLNREISDKLLLETGAFAYVKNGVSDRFKDPNNKSVVIRIMIKQGNEAKLNKLIKSYSETFASQKDRLKITKTIKTPFIEKIIYPELKLHKKKGVSFEGLDMLESTLILKRIENESLGAVLALKQEMGG